MAPIETEGWTKDLSQIQKNIDNAIVFLDMLSYL